MLNIETASLDSQSQEEIDQLYNIIIKGYELTEEEVWGKHYIRIFRPEFDALVNQKQVLIAKYNGIVVGGIHHYQLANEVYTFSLLATDFAFSGKGFGTALIEAVEDIALKTGHKKVQMEILRVKGLDTVSKLKLAKFYEKLGYQYTHSEDCSCKIPMPKYGRLKAQSDFDFYVKSL